MKLTEEDKKNLINWMKTKPTYKELIGRVGEEKAVQVYVKSRGEERLSYILLSMKKRKKYYKNSVSKFSNNFAQTLISH